MIPSQVTARTLKTQIVLHTLLSPACVVLAISWICALAQGAYVPSSIIPPKPERELRGAWIATVANIDWPSTNTLTTSQQKAELISILDRARALKLNTLIFQVRPSCDALYASPIEPWSEYLTGTMGKPPQPYYDPLALAVEEAHKRGLELHAWFNPYRARHEQAKSPISATHISRTKPQLVRQYGKYLWLDPGEKEVQDYSLSVVMDVVKRYDIDGVHFDDYFYPYKEKDGSGREIDFPDEQSWQRFGAGGKLNREDWRRENVNVFIRGVYESIKATKPWVKFGVSPFGIWRPHNPPQIQGYDAYENLYADSRKWLQNGWLDYFAPQLYWGINPPEQSFPVLLKWWSEQNTKGRLLVPGMDTTKTARRWQPEEIINQIRLARKEPKTGGHIHWDMKALMRNGALDTALERDVYSQPALVPVMPWLDHAAPEKPKLSVSSGLHKTLRWEAGGSEKPWLWVVQIREANQWNAQILPGSQTSLKLEPGHDPVFAITAVDRCGNTSRPAVIEQN